MSNETLLTKTQATGRDQESKNQDRVPCEVYSRIVGYLRPVQNWNKGKKQEFAARRTYQVKDKVVE
jgi:anaerobic ribonucleoside-triphosphate reductase